MTAYKSEKTPDMGTRIWGRDADMGTGLKLRVSIIPETRIDRRSVFGLY